MSERKATYISLPLAKVKPLERSPQAEIRQLEFEVEGLDQKLTKAQQEIEQLRGQLSKARSLLCRTRYRMNRYKVAFLKLKKRGA